MEYEGPRKEGRDRGSEGGEEGRTERKKVPWDFLIKGSKGCPGNALLTEHHSQGLDLMGPSMHQILG